MVGMPMFMYVAVRLCVQKVRLRSQLDSIAWFYFLLNLFSFLLITYFILMIIIITFRTEEKRKFGTSLM